MKIKNIFKNLAIESQSRWPMGGPSSTSRSRHTSHNARASSRAKGTTRCADSGAPRTRISRRDGTCAPANLTSAHATDQRGDAGEKLRPTRRPATLRRSDASSRCGGGPRGASGPSRGPRGPTRPSRRAARESHFLDASRILPPYSLYVYVKTGEISIGIKLSSESGSRPVETGGCEPPLPTELVPRGR